MDMEILVQRNETMRHLMNVYHRQLKMQVSMMQKKECNEKFFVSKHHGNVECKE